MKTWQVEVYKRQTWQPSSSYSYSYSGSWVNATQYEYIDADRCEIMPAGQLLFWNGDVSKLQKNEYNRTVLGFRFVEIIAIFHADQWLAVKEYIDDGE